MPVFNWFKVTSGIPGQLPRHQRQTQHTTTVISEWEATYYSTQQEGSMTQDFSQNHPRSQYNTNNVPYHGSTRPNYQSPPQASPYSQALAPVTHESYQTQHPSHASPIAYCSWHVTYVVPHNHDNRGPSSQHRSFDPVHHTAILPEIIFATEQNARRTAHEEEQEYISRMTCAPLIRCIPLPPIHD